MKTAFWARRAHKWIGLIVGVQALLWMIGGVYMTIIPLGVIHGNHLAHAPSERLHAGTTRISQRELMSAYPGATSVKLRQLAGRDVYEVTRNGAPLLVDASSGVAISPLKGDVAEILARQAYQGDGELIDVSWITEAPQEVSTRPVPMWAASFSDWNETTLYFSPQTGELLARRHNLWRWFDFVWMLHIMDYETRSDVNNTLLRVATFMGLIFSLSGVWLLLYSFRRRANA